MAAFSYPSSPRAVAALAIGAALACSAAAAQTMDSNSASYNGGYGRYNGQENRPVEAGTRDENGNRLIVNGIIQSNATSFASADLSGVADVSTGVGGGSATAIGNNLVVVTQGNYNTVIIDSTQINNGNVSANTSLNGGVSNGP